MKFTMLKEKQININNLIKLHEDDCLMSNMNFSFDVTCVFLLKPWIV